MGLPASQHQVSPSDASIITVATVNTKAAVIFGAICGTQVEMMLDPGSTVSLLQQGAVPYDPGYIKTLPEVRKHLLLQQENTYQLLDTRAPIQLGTLQLMHDFIVVKNLVAPVILGVDFLCTNGLILDFTTIPVTVHHSNKHLSQGIPKSSGTQEQLFSMCEAANKKRARICAVKALEDPSTDMIEECAIPRFQDSECYDYPECATSQLNTVLHDY